MEIRKSIRTGKQQTEDRIIAAIETRLGIVRTEIEKNEELFLNDKAEQENLLLSLKEDIHKLEQHLQELCNTVSKHDATITMQTPIINQVQQSITELKVKVELMEKGIKL